MSIVIPTMRGVLTGFSPLSLSPALWLDAADPSTLYDATTGGNLVAAGGAIARWQDKSGNARHVTQGTLANRPTRQTVVQNSKDVIRFDGVNDFIDISDSWSPTGAATFFVVSYSSNSSITLNNYRALVNYGLASIGSSIFLQYATDANFGTNALGVSQYGSGFGLSNRLQTWNIQSVSKPASTGVWNQWINGGNLTSKSMTTNTTLGSQFRIGANNQAVGIGSYFAGDIAEIIIFPTALSTINRQRVERYLGSKWGIAVA